MPNECELCGDELDERRMNTHGLFNRTMEECEDCRRWRLIVKRANRSKIGGGSASEELKRELA